MSARKLQQEIDKVFKKVKEGLEVFDQLYDKLQMCESQPQKEKIESDLKKEIKKLQRQRDQIKNWASGNDVKDKKPLLENRRLIENAMERFKEVERSTKTKAFSKEGLSMERVDPKQKEKNDLFEFLQSMLDELERQNEKYEAAVDQIQSSGKKGRKLDSSKQSEVDELQEKIERNNWHQEKLEQILRMVENDALDCDSVNAIREDISYYVDSNEDADFAEDEGIYDELGLDEIEEAFGAVGEFPHIEDNEDAGPEKGSLASLATQSPEPAPAPLATPQPALPTPSKQLPPLHTHVTAPVSAQTPTATTPVAANLKPAVVPKTELKYASVASAAIANVNSAANTPKTLPATLNHSTLNPTLSTASTPLLSAARTSADSDVVNSPAELLSSAASAAIAPGSVMESLTATPINTAPLHASSRREPTLESLEDLFPAFRAISERLAHPEPFEQISKILETSLLNCPDSLDSDRPRSYHPQNPHPSSVFYPQEPVPELSYSSTVSKLDISTLFFNFYYNQGEYIQILSARELVKKGWEFDTKSQKWYTKVEEIQPPSLIGDQISNPEKAIAWKYFDNEGVWLPRRKDDFNPDAVELISSF